MGGVWYHVWNAGNGRAEVFHKPGDYASFVQAMHESNLRLPADLLGYCILPNHFHLLLRFGRDGDLGRWMQWLLTTHARRYHRQYETTGHVWQGRFKAFAVEDGEPLAAVLHYVERNPLRAELVTGAELWPWSSLSAWLAGDVRLWSGSGQLRTEQWQARVSEPLAAGELKRIRHSLVRGKPFGGRAWTREMAVKLGLESSLRRPGRPKKPKTSG